MASLADAQALTGACTAAAAPNVRPRFAAGAFDMSMGMVKGDTRRSPFSFCTSHCPSRVCRPPMPVPTLTSSR